MFKLKPKNQRWIQLIKEYNEAELAYKKLYSNDSSKKIQETLFNYNQAKQKLKQYTKNNKT